MAASAANPKIARGQGTLIPLLQIPVEVAERVPAGEEEAVPHWITGVTAVPTDMMAERGHSQEEAPEEDLTGTPQPEMLLHLVVLLREVEEVSTMAVAAAAAQAARCGSARLQ